MERWNRDTIEEYYSLFFFFLAKNITTTTATIAPIIAGKLLIWEILLIDIWSKSIINT